MEYPAAGSFRLDVGGPDDLAPLFCVFCYEPRPLLPCCFVLTRTYSIAGFSILVMALRLCDDDDDDGDDEQEGRSEENDAQCGPRCGP
jgi:hypothetical protein